MLNKLEFGEFCNLSKLALEKLPFPSLNQFQKRRTAVQLVSIGRGVWWNFKLLKAMLC
jgi:hypothetical protein